MSRILAGLTVLAVAGCASDPLVSDFNGSSVKLQTSEFMPLAQAKAQSLAEANRICGKVGKHAEYASSREMPGYVLEHLFLCL